MINRTTKLSRRLLKPGTTDYHPAIHFLPRLATCHPLAAAHTTKRPRNAGIRLPFAQVGGQFVISTKERFTQTALKYRLPAFDRHQRLSMVPWSVRFFGPKGHSFT